MRGEVWERAEREVRGERWEGRGKVADGLFIEANQNIRLHPSIHPLEIMRGEEGGVGGGIRGRNE